MTGPGGTEPLVAETRLRLDKWLWAARFYKTRGLAAAAVDAGKVRVNQAPAKPAREVKPGDVIDLEAAGVRWTVEILALNVQRRPAAEACRLYRETGASQARRAAEAELRRLAPVPGASLHGRPTKRAGRLIRRLA